MQKLEMMSKDYDVGIVTYEVDEVSFNKKRHIVNNLKCVKMTNDQKLI